MLKPATIHFLEQLAVNNNKPWFDEHRTEYTAAKDDFEAFVAHVLGLLGEQVPEFREQKAKDCIFRIFRDVRFSKDKTPYKPNFGAFFSIGGRKFPGAGYYLHLQPGNNSFVGGGMWLPEAPLLKAIRQEIDYNFPAFKTVVENEKFVGMFEKISGEKLKSIPQGYTEDNPAAEYLKLKSFTVQHTLTDKKISGKRLAATTMEVFTIMRPFIDFLNNAVGTRDK